MVAAGTMLLEFSITLAGCRPKIFKAQVESDTKVSICCPRPTSKRKKKNRYKKTRFGVVLTDRNDLPYGPYLVGRKCQERSLR
jgi:hypothetical protein